jgi:pyruvate dehydrogenase E1 component alpha subunit
VVFICENNQYAMSFAADEWTTSKKIAAHGEIYGMSESCSTDGNDLLEVKSAVSAAVERARDGGGPTLIVNDTYRWRGHSKSDRNRYRTKEEIEEWKDRDPILKFRKYCAENELLSEKEAEKIKEQGYEDIESARVFAESSPEPTVDTLEEGVYAP